MLNKIFLMGRLVADPDSRQTPGGVSVTTVRLAVDRDFRNKETGEKEADFFTVVTWRATADFVSRYFTKGRMMVVDGRLQSRNYVDRDGNKRSAVEVIADNVYFGDSRRDGDGGFAPRTSFQESSQAPYDPPAGDTDQFSELDDNNDTLPF